MKDDTPPVNNLSLHQEHIYENSTSSSPHAREAARTGSPAALRGPAIPDIKVECDPSETAATHTQHQNSVSRSAGSSASLANVSTHKSGRMSSPMGSMLELKRFFGKGRKKIEHGVAHGERRPHVEPAHQAHQVQQAHPAHSAHVTPVTSHKKEAERGERAERPTIKKHHSLGSLFGLHKHNKKHEHPHAANVTAGGLQHSVARDFGDMEHPVVLGKPPKDLDPNFVVHGPDYEADWDPFHVFGLEPNSERMPFLESGITKYGQIGRDMGSGAGGSVRMMERPSDHKVFAVKEFRKRRPNESMQKYAKTMTAEYALGAALHHKNLIETIDLIKEGDKYYEVMEFGEHDFFELVMSGELSTPQINSAFKQIMDGVAYLHSMGVAHRDIKLDNCVVDGNGVVKLIDFGSAVIFRYPASPKIHLARGILGSDPYLAPEVFERRPYQPQCADIWSCGIIYCCEYLRRFPWKLPKSEDASYRKFAENPANLDGEHPHQENSRKITGPWRVLRLLPRDSRPIIGHILTIDVAKRATLEDIYADPWFKSIEIISVLPDKKSKSNEKDKDQEKENSSAASTHQQSLSPNLSQNQSQSQSQSQSPSPSQSQSPSHTSSHTSSQN